MFAKTTLLSLATLAIYTVANPAGVSIPTPARRALTNPDGSFDINSAILETVALSNKIRSGLLAVTQNSGAGALNPGAVILPVATVPSGLRKRGAVPLNNIGDAVWPGQVTVGTPPAGQANQQFAQLFDTLIADIWVPSVGCTTSECDGKDKYDASKSTTDVPRSGTYSNDGTTGPILSDTVSVGGIVSKNQYFSAVTAISPDVAGAPADGFFGLGFPCLATINGLTFLENAHNQGSLRNREFGWYRHFGGTGSELFLGGTNPALYKGQPDQYPVNRGSGYWQIQNGRVKIDGRTIINTAHTIMDITGNFIYGPVNDVKTFYAAFPGSAVYLAQYNFYSVPCNSTHKASFNWGGRDWPISSLIGPPVATGSTQCIAYIVGGDLGLGNNVWTLGDQFLSSVYTVFSVERNTVGFAELAT